MKRTCHKCGKEKELTNEFFPHNKRGPDGFDNRCKVCWSVISKAKTKKKAEGNTGQNKMAARNKQKGWQGFKTKAKAEVVPEGVTVVPLAENKKDLPKDALFMLWEDGGLLDAIAAYRKKTGVDPQVVYTPAMFLLQYPPGYRPTIGGTAHKADKPAKQDHSKKEGKYVR